MLKYFVLLIAASLSFNSYSAPTQKQKPVVTKKAKKTPPTTSVRPDIKKPSKVTRKATVTKKPIKKRYY